MTRDRSLDGLRGIAVLAVVAFHLDGDVIRGGYLGVSVFFVLSGYLITRLLLSEIERSGAIDARAFYVRRAYRLVPALVVATGFGVAVALFEGESENSAIAAGLLTALTFTTDLAVTAGLDIGTMSHTWSLGVEEQFYLAWPLVIVTLGLSRPGRLARFCLVAGGPPLSSTQRCFRSLAGNTSTSRRCHTYPACSPEPLSPACHSEPPCSSRGGSEFSAPGR